MHRLCTTKCASISNLSLVLGGRRHRKNVLIAAQSRSSASSDWYPGGKLLGSVNFQPVALGAAQKSVLDAKGVNLCSCIALVQQRQQSTTTTNAEQQPLELAKKKSKKRPKYVELLEVTDTSSTQSMTRVQRINAKTIQKLIKIKRMAIIEKQKKHVELEEKRLERQVKRKRKMQPIEYRELDIEAQVDSSIIASGQYDDRPMIFCNDSVENVRYFDDPKEVANILKSFQNFRSIIESIEHEKEETMEAENLLPALDIQKDVQDNTMDSAEPYLKIDVAEEHEKVVNEAAVVTKSKSRYKSKTHICEEQERQAKITALRTHLSTYLNICTSAGLVNRAQTIIIAYRSRAVRNKRQSPITIQLYNILLQGLAEKSLFERFKAVFDMIKEDELKFNEQTFAAIFECLGRMEVTEENNAKVEEFIKMAEEESLTLHQIMNNSKFVRDQREMVLQAIRRVQPDFSPVYVPPQLGYDNLLLNHLNENVPSIGDEPVPKQTEHPLPGSQIMHPKYGYTKEDLLERAREQMELELKGSITIKSIEKSKTYANASFCRQRLKEVEAIWRKQIHDAVIRDMNSFKAQIHSKPNGYMNYFTYLRSVDPRNFVDILMKEILNIAGASETYSATVSQLYKDLGMQVYRRHQLDQKQKTGVQEKLSHIYADYCTWWDEGTNMKTSDNTRQLWQRLVHNERKSGPSMDLPDLHWPQSVLYGVGRFLYNILVRDIKIDSQVMRKGVQSKPQNLIPAFYTLYRNKGRLVREEIKPHPLLARLVRASQQQTLTFDTNLVPMLCPPQPWSTHNNGGYLLTPSDLIRLPHQAVLQLQRINTSNPQHLYPALDSLNQLASIPWRVNTDVLDVIIEVFQNGGDPKVDVPQPPASLPALPEIETHDSTKSKAQLSKLFKDKLARRRKQAEMFSLWCDALYRLSLANHYRDKVFWLPHNMDFRGRVYPLPPHLNHLGSDMARSMLIFDKALPLGPDGFNWLKLHCINLTGLMKREPVEIRLAYADKIMDDILDSADRPLTGRKWWAKSDEPWQTLACCQEIAKVHRSEDKEAYLCRFPIHQDGSCNGLQHYAALGRDKAGGLSVNLSPCDKPQDVYSAVVALVEKSRKVDAENNILVAQALDGFVQRKVIKQTVMTTVYGVTRFGARLQIARQLKDNDNFPKEYVWPASTYLTTKTFESLREMFSSAREIQDWFTDCARYISSVRGKHVEWVTPLGLPIVQPYNRTEVYTKTANSPRIRETLSMDMFERPNVMKQKNAFPPNFIHSLDSSHMMLTSLHCERKGMTFVSVHDCFWTHACTVPDMNKICREQFVALHSQPIIEDLSKFLRDRYSFGPSELQNDNTKEEMSKLKLNQVLRLLPEKGDFDLNSVLDSTYFFS